LHDGDEMADDGRPLKQSEIPAQSSPLDAAAVHAGYYLFFSSFI
jgi:hypothetical protein